MLHTPLAQPHDLTCQVCEKQCFNTEKFYRHMHKYHPDYWRVFAGDRPLTDFINPEARPVKEKPFSCQLCHKKYSHETGLTKHLVTHPEYRNDPNFKDAEIFTCSVCEKIFTRENYLERHMEMKHDEEHARAYEIYRQKYVKKTPIILDPHDPNNPAQPPPLPPPMMDHSGLKHGGGNQGANRDSDHHHHVMGRQFSLDSHPMALAAAQSGMRTETVARPPPESPSDSEMDELARQGAGHPGSANGRSSNVRGTLPSHSESFQSDASFDKSSPSGRPASQRELPPRWSETNTPQESPRGFSTGEQGGQQQPFDMSQRQPGMPAGGGNNGGNDSSSKSHSAPPSRGPVDSLPVFPDSFPSQSRPMKDKDSPLDESGNNQRQSMRGSYLHRQMADIEEQNHRQGAAPHLPPTSQSSGGGFLERTLSAPHETQQSSYEQYLRDQLLTDPGARAAAEKSALATASGGGYSQRSGSRDDIPRDDHYLRGQVSVDSASRDDPHHTNMDYYSQQTRNSGGANNGDVYRHQQQQQTDDFLDRHRLAKSASVDGSMTLGRGSHDDAHLPQHQQIDRHYFSPRSPANIGPVHEAPPNRLIDSHEPHRHDDGGRFHEYPAYGAASHGLFPPPPPSHGGLSRDRLSGQFPFNLPPTSLQHTGFPHGIGQRPPLGGQYPPLPRSEEEIAQALESLARAMRPFR